LTFRTGIAKFWHEFTESESMSFILATRNIMNIQLFPQQTTRQLNGMAIRRVIVAKNGNVKCVKKLEYYILLDELF
jgi:hypothetical protein